jgi:hypothetical protein
MSNNQKNGDSDGNYLKIFLLFFGQQKFGSWEKN